MPDLLITGFGPFPGVRRNPTSLLAPAVARLLAKRGIAPRALILPTSYSQGLPLLAAELDRLKPRAVLMLGLAGKSRFIRIERFARVDASPTAPDAGGGLPEGNATRSQACSLAMPLASTAALEPALAAMQRAGLRARMSPSAGRYLCNASYAVALQKSPRDVPVLFVHVPWPRGWRGQRPAASVPAWRPAFPALAHTLASVAREALLRRARCSKPPF